MDIGFVGLGAMGAGIVPRLMAAGHSVTGWNRSKAKAEPLIASGMRYALPNARIMVHQPSGGFSGQASDIERHAEDIIKMKRRLNEVYVKHTKKSYEVIDKTLDRDYFMTAEQAREFGIIDRVIKSRDEAEATLTPVKPVQG